MKKLLITVPVYGELYSDIFLDLQLGAMLDDTNIPLHADRVDYAIYTDNETLPKIMEHPNFKVLREFVPTARFFTFSWPDNADRFHNRYQVLISTFRMSVNEGLKTDSYLSAIVADLVPAKGYIGKLLAKLDEGHDSVFMLPPRSAYESMNFYLSQTKGALSPFELFDLCYQNLHPLWVACHWDAAQFSKLPFTLLWNSGSGLLARSFSITPIAFTPKHEMLSATRVIDVEVPSMCKNPYWATDWVDAPIIGVEPLKCYYPPFANWKASSQRVRDWGRECLHHSQFEFLKQKLYFPSQSVVNMPAAKKLESNGIVERVCLDQTGNAG